MADLITFLIVLAFVSAGFILLAVAWLVWLTWCLIRGRDKP